MNRKFLKASLKLWRWRKHNWQRKLTATKSHDHAAFLSKRIAGAQKIIDRRLKQLEASAPVARGAWMPGAIRRERSGTPWQVSASVPGRIVLHTTEGYGDATPTLDSKRAWPQFHVLRDGKIIQYLPMTVGGRALQHTEATPTNGANAFQIEIEGFARDPHYPTAQLLSLRRLCRFIEANGNVARRCDVSFTHPVRLTNEQWLLLRGYCGHVHVPQNDHVDPGPIDIRELL